MAEYGICESLAPMWFMEDMKRAADAKRIAELEQAAVDLAKAFRLIDDNDFINSYESQDESACAHWRGIARDAAATIQRLTVQPADAPSEK